MKLATKSFLHKMTKKSNLHKVSSELTIDATEKSSSSFDSSAEMDSLLSEQEVRALFDLWNSALLTLDPDQVAARYSSHNPCLLPTVSDIPRTDYLSIKDYFVHFLAKKPLGIILESHVTVGPNWCMDNGIYVFALQATGDVVKARYSFVYVKEGDEWKISHHHSSQMPEEVVAKNGLLGNILKDMTKEGLLGNILKNMMVCSAK